MGGCCCASRRDESNRTPIYIYFPQELEENEPLSTSHVTSIAVPVGHLLDTTLAASIPDTYRAPPAPLPYDVGLAFPETVPRNIGDCVNKTDNIQSTNPLTAEETVSAAGYENSDTCDSLKGTECKCKMCKIDSPKVKDDEFSKLTKPFSQDIEDEDVCPTCLEEYDKENPRIITKCEHHFHLSCILEWMERSNSCPICDQIMMIDHTSEE